MSSGNGWYLVHASVASDPDLTYGTSRYEQTGSATVGYPEQTHSPNDAGNIGGNFQFVPEPASLGLACLGFSAAMLRRRRSN